MANVKITQLPLATTPLTGTEVFPLVQGTTTKQVAITGLFTSPVMTNPTLGTVGQADLINATGLPISTGVAGLGTGVATFLGTPSSTNLRAAVTDETGTGSLVFATSPTLVTPDLGTPSVLVATNATGTAVGLTAGSAITNANLTGAVTSVGNATSLGSFTSAQLRTALTDETGAGSAVFATSPTITAPILNQINDTNNAQILGLSPTTSAVDYLVVKNGIGVGVPLHFYADGSSANIGLHIQPKGTGLVTISDGTDFNKGIRFRSSSSAASAITLLDAVSTAGRVVTLPDATTTLVGRDTTDTLTNKTIAFSSNTFTGALAIANGGTGQATANAALNALLPAQTGNASKYLQTDGTNSSWDAISLSTADITGTLGTANGGTGLTSFTSGGVVYASSTSALATGGNLTYNGTSIFSLSAPSPEFKIGRSTGNQPKLSFGGPSSTEFYLQADSATGILRYDAGPSVAWGGIHAWYVDQSERMRLTSTGLGIGTSSPTQKLDVYAGGNGTGVRISNPTFGSNASPNYTELFFGLQNYSTGYASSIRGYNSGLDNFNSFLTFNTCSSNAAPTERMRITSAGDVGIGTSSPAYRVDISGTNPRIRINETTGYVLTSYLNTGGSFDVGRDNSAGLISGAAYAGFLNVGGAYPLIFNINSVERMRLDSAGNLGLGVTPSAWGSTWKVIQIGMGGSIFARTADQNRIGITANAYFDTSFKYIGTGQASFYDQDDGAHFWYTAASGTAGNAISFTQAMTLDASGNLLLGTTSSGSLPGDGYVFIKSTSTQYIGHASGTSSGTGYMQFWYAGGSIGSITQSGTTAVLYNLTSDQRLKENIQDAESSSNLIDAIQVRQFDWKSDGSHTRYGFIAQELVTVAPEAVHQPTDTEEMMAVDYSKLVPMLVKEIQSLRARVAQLER